MSRMEGPSNIRGGAGTGSRMLKENGLVPRNVLVLTGLATFRVVGTQECDL
jgi:hypothetical protein